MSRFASRKKQAAMPRLPLRGSYDLTYRCNNDCLHCWLRLPASALEGRRELTFEEIRRIADEARRLGCQRWAISGGEPMLRPDFADIFAYLADRSAPFTLNTNGTLITPEIARLMTRKGSKLIALYGATADVHDRVTRTPGSFEALKRGIAYLIEAGAGFTVQIVPMRDNFHQYEAMVRLAESWSPRWRLGASWLHLSACGEAAKNRQILEQRLDPAEVLGLEESSIPEAEDFDAEDPSQYGPGGQGGLYAACVAGRRDFHIDPYGGMSFCDFVKDPGLRCDLRRVSFQEAWEKGIPAMAATVRPDDEFASNCGACELRNDCRWCPAYAYLEYRNHSARVEYLCQIARGVKAFKESRLRTHRRFYSIAGITVQVSADLPILDETFRPKFELFRTSGRGENTISVHHCFSLPDVEGRDLGHEIYRKAPWAVFRKGGTWIYLGIFPDPEDRRLHRVMVFNEGHTRARIYHPSSDLFLSGRSESLMFLASDQTVLARVLPAWGGAFIHAAGVSLNGHGLIFAGPSEAGKSTITKMLMNKASILCDDRVIVRKGKDDFRVYGTWSHGEISDVSPESAPLRAIFFLRQAGVNRLERMADRRAVVKELLPRFVRPLLTADWWEEILSLAVDVSTRVPCYQLFFDKSGGIVNALEEFLS